jgi:hypothetical protein
MMRMVVAVIVALVLVCPATVIAQSSPFVGNWRPIKWHPHGRNLGIVLHIAQEHGELAGTIHFYDPSSEHESVMLNPRVSGKTFTFDVEDEYVKERCSFSMIVEERDRSAVVKYRGREILLDFKLVKEP